MAQEIVTENEVLKELNRYDIQMTIQIEIVTDYFSLQQN